MLRCTVAGLLPLINSQRYAEIADSLFQDNLNLFQKITQHKSYYLLRALPAHMAHALLAPIVPELTAKQMQNGLWRSKDGVKTTYEIFAALRHADFALDSVCRYSPLPHLRELHDGYAILTKRLLGESLTQEDNHVLTALIREIANQQAADGSFGETVCGTVIQMERLLELGLPADNPIILRGSDYLLSQRKEQLQGMHTNEPYCLTVPNLFTSEDRGAEFAAAQALKPEWIPRHVCFHTMAMIPNGVCVNLLLRLGLEKDAGVSAALESLYRLYQKHGGFCATNIKKPYL